MTSGAPGTVGLSSVNAHALPWPLPPSCLCAVLAHLEAYLSTSPHTLHTSCTQATQTYTQGLRSCFVAERDAQSRADSGGVTVNY
jgi:hypothetical protein